ncbi:SDR family oxidoreductase [Streptomyces fuscichromogenes]|uniref:3-oxoacyl-ACP reductase n=1 Tax=Streptomyces fuscichromogenes TaxID=1324013 RepID=A0A917X9N8_9ACTN|nr:SDR family oxidoreductase [Streptomyces fuscichromogenes]GGM97905.1 3-oxoacyl-ACP reductase [Streptomyces fuscichromogenes]
MTQRFMGKAALVTGASRGIGFAIARRLVADGARVCLTARKEEALDAAVSELGGPANAIAVAGRADDPAHQADAVRRTVEAFGGVDLLVNNAGTNPAYGPLLELDLAAARKTFEVNCLAAISWVQRVHRAWMGEHGGAIVNVSSLSASQSAPGMGFYGATKAMLNRVTQQLATELGPGIRVNAVAPGLVKTRFAEVLYRDKEDAVVEAYPLKRLGVPEDIGDTVSFLLSSDASWLTGQLVVVDGGVSLAGAG